MKKKYFLLLLTGFLFFIDSFSQCGVVKTVTVCDMTSIDYNNDTIADGIINLYDEYNTLPGVTPISNTTGTWYDPNFNFSLDVTTGDLHLWDLTESSMSETNYQFQLLDSSSGCTNDLMVTLNIIVGPFSGIVSQTIGTDHVNAEVCDAPFSTGCRSETFFDLFTTLSSTPSAHNNGVWSYEGNSPNFIEIEENRILIVNIPYQEGPPLIDDEIFELIYTVPGISPCDNSMETRVRISVVRGAFSGAIDHYGIANRVNICETELLSGTYDTDINLLDDTYLVGENIEGTWSEMGSLGQIENPGDSFVNLKEIYDDLLLINPRFKFKNYFFNYNVHSRSGVCSDMNSVVKISFFENLRSFEQENTEEFCLKDDSLSTISLYSLITFTTENDVLYDYPKDECTNWRLISGPSNLGLVSNTGDICSVTEDPNYSSQGIIDLSDLTDADVGTYVFEYRVSEDYNSKIVRPYVGSSSQDFNNCELTFISPSGCFFTVNYDHPCSFGDETTLVTIIIHPYNYPGENTSIELCESDISNPVNLISLLETNDEDSIYLGPDSYWYNLDTGQEITNSFIFPEIDGNQTFHLQYRITANNCEEQANLTLTIHEQYLAGSDGIANVCIEDSNFELFDSLNGLPDDNGSWVGPDGFSSTSNLVDFHPDTFESGEYIYTVPSNGVCDERSATVTVNIHPLSNAGENVEEIVCKLDNQVDLLDLLDSDVDEGGTFIDLDNTNALNGSIVDLSMLTDNSYSFQYDVQPNAACVLTSSVITLVVNDVSIPIVSDQSFCIGYGATVADLEVSSSQDNYNWYANDADMITLDTDLILQNGEDYFVTAVNENDCESERVKVTVTLIEFGLEGCISCVNDGISANGDNENDSLEICDLPSVFPNFDIKIFNRYGNTIYTGNINSPLFDGTSNVSLTLGDQVPAGVYFYIFSPNDGVTKPFQGDFYLSR